MSHLLRLALQCLCVSLPIAALAAGSGQVDERPAADRQGRPLQVALLVLEGVYNSELIAPMDIFHHTVFHTRPGMRVFTVGRSREMVTTFEGLRIGVDHDLESAPPFDVLVVPSALHNMDSDLSDARLIDWIRDRGSACRFVLSVCDGAFLLAQAGLLNGRFCTTFPGDIPAFRKRFGHLRVVEGVTFVADGPLITGVGGARSYEPALYLVERLYGKPAARGVARGMVLDWDLDKQRHFIVPHSGSADRATSFLPGERIDDEVEVEDANGNTIPLKQIIAKHGNVKAVVLTILSGAEARGNGARGGLWCEDSFSELINLRHLKLKFERRGVLFVGVVCPPIHHERLYGFDEGAFVRRPPDDTLYQRNRNRFVEATRRLEAAGILPFDVVVYDPRFTLLTTDPEASAPAWHGRFRWFADTQTYGTPTTWVLTKDLTVLGPPFFMNVYESQGRKLRYTTDDISQMIEICRQQR